MMIKKITVVALSMGILLAACGGGEAPKDETEVAQKVNLSDNPDYKKGLGLIAQSDCLGCHKVDETLTGPSYRDVANKYAGADDAQITKLAETIIAGSSGNWGSIPMTAHPDLSIEDAKAMVKYILLLKN